jgi:hypothetical protein
MLDPTVPAEAPTDNVIEVIAATSATVSDQSTRAPHRRLTVVRLGTSAPVASRSMHGPFKADWFIGSLTG